MCPDMVYVFQNRNFLHQNWKRRQYTYCCDLAVPTWYSCNHLPKPQRYTSISFFHCIDYVLLPDNKVFLLDCHSTFDSTIRFHCIDGNPYLKWEAFLKLTFVSNQSHCLIFASAISINPENKHHANPTLSLNCCGRLLIIFLYLQCQQTSKNDGLETIRKA